MKQSKNGLNKEASMEDILFHVLPQERQNLAGGFGVNWILSGSFTLETEDPCLGYLVATWGWCDALPLWPTSVTCGTEDKASSSTEGVLPSQIVLPLPDYVDSQVVVGKSVPLSPQPIHDLLHLLQHNRSYDPSSLRTHVCQEFSSTVRSSDKALPLLP